MLEYFILAFTFLLVLLYTKTVYLPRHNFNRIKKSLESLGYKVKAYPFMPFDSSEFSAFKED